MGVIRLFVFRGWGGSISFSMVCGTIMVQMPDSLWRCLQPHILVTAGYFSSVKGPSDDLRPLAGTLAWLCQVNKQHRSPHLGVLGSCGWNSCNFWNKVLCGLFCTLTMQPCAVPPQGMRYVLEEGSYLKVTLGTVKYASWLCEIFCSNSVVE